MYKSAGLFFLADIFEWTCLKLQKNINTAYEIFASKICHKNTKAQNCTK
jgi:hypothetical protein